MGRTAKTVELPALAPLDRAAGQLGRQLAQQLRDAIRKGTLRPGEPLPSTRLLASAIGVARGTVVEAFEQLIAEGFLDARGGAGTVVSMGLADPARRGDKAGTNRADSARAGTDTRPAVARMEDRPLPAPALRYAAITRTMHAAPNVPFAVSVPLGAIAPDDTWRKIGNRVRASRIGAPAGYLEPQGLRSLRVAIADYVRRSRSVRCDADQVIITAGTQQGLHLACQVLLDASDQAWVEDPGYLGITSILAATGPAERMVRVPVDEDGMRIDEGLRRAPKARVAFVTPSHQYPLGMPMSMPRREALLQWARARNAWIVEDDYDSEMRYAGHPFPALQGLDCDRVVYLGTFSKILFPSLRLGYLIAPHDLVPAFCGARILMDRFAPNTEQHVLAAFINEGHLDRHIRRVRSAYAENRALLMALLARHLPPGLASLQPGDQGMHLVVWLADGLSDVEIVRQAAELGIAARALSPTYAGDVAPVRQGLILGFGGYAEADLARAVTDLAAIIARLGQRTRTAGVNSAPGSARSRNATA
ncbi:MocR-like pyridoxine biosynthesis transcription factor PdxR [Achromobacter aloeverae]|uniref:DNA-binding protein n=1 Tax=Achromobacter aloeverae TaxID=1750518 RepID=A0A4Q1HJH4_9BURK|nr:PLP-dependent aminotransferase family protein [Achromobacter aloeverae]RXN90254.1 DNA-binding protein [Achromobacter aloeverae]